MGILLLYVIHTIDASECQKPKKTLISIISMKICLLYFVPEIYLVVAKLSRNNVFRNITYNLRLTRRYITGEA